MAEPRRSRLVKQECDGYYAGMRTLQGRIKKTLDYASWAYMPRTRLSTVQLYELIATDTVAPHGLFINMGYWRDAQSVDRACEAMVQLLAETIQLGGDDVVLDVGFGFGEQDVYWMTRFSPRRIVGINIVPSQVMAARQRVAERGMADRIQLHLASATSLPFDAGRFTAIIALECGFHFATRERFFEEAYRVLRPGGRLVLRDIIPVAKPHTRWRRLHHDQSWQMFSRTWVSRPANAYPRAEYAEKLTAAGFATVRVDSIRDDVFAGYHAYCTTQADYLQRLNPVIRLHHRTARILGAEVTYGRSTTSSRVPERHSTPRKMPTSVGFDSSGSRRCSLERELAPSEARPVDTSRYGGVSSLLARSAAEKPVVHLETVPAGHGEAQVRLVVADTEQSVFTPAISARAGVIVREVAPGIAIRRVIFADRPPLTLGQVWPPAIPV